VGAIAITSLAKLDRALERFKPRYLISLCDPFAVIDHCPLILPREHLRLACHDTNAESNQPGYPNDDLARQLLEFWERCDPRARALVHCNAGKSRSPATAILLLAHSNPGDEERVALISSEILPHAQPNTRLIEAGDRVLRLNGRLVAAVKAMPKPTAVDFEEDFVAFHEDRLNMGRRPRDVF
jgi:predicted protein tyrosine phosphatase